MEMQEVFAKAEEKMKKVEAQLAGEYSTVRAGRANPGVLDKLQVDYYGVDTPINQMAAISVPDARTLMIQPWDKSTLRPIEKAIQASDIGINPQNDGTSLRLNFPPLTEERRKEIAKTVLKYAEEGKVAVRNIRRESIEKLKAMKKDSAITEDDLKDGEKEMQTLTDKYNKQIDEQAAKKEKEILEL